MLRRPTSVRSLAARGVLTAALAIPLMAGCAGDSPTTDDGSAATEPGGPSTTEPGGPSTTEPGGPSTDATGASDELASVIADAQRMAPALEGRLGGTEYPTTLAAARQVLADAGIEPSVGNVVNGYEYDPDTIEFVLCIEGPTGAFASYDTRPMSLFTTGETGGCPTP